MNDDWNKLCRACLTTRDSFNYYLVEDISVETYLFCTSVEIREEDALPKSLCNDCYNLLEQYSEFKRTCIESQNTLLLCSKAVKDEETQPIQPYLHQRDEAKENESDINLKSDWEFQIGVKQEELTDSFAEDSFMPDLSDGSIENIVLISKRTKKAKNGLIKRKPLKQEYKCDLCNRVFLYRKRFDAHKLEHEGVQIRKDTTLHCQRCNKTFLTVSGYSRHEESKHSTVRLSSISCSHCGRVCASKHALTAHEKKHRIEHSHVVCHLCGKRVSSDTVLKDHLETHKSDRERCHTCEHCGKKFFTNRILLAHIKRQHTGVRYICDVCSYPFTDKYNLMKHLLIHEGKKLYKCDICEKSYGTNASLVEHKRIHSGERPFGCSFCQKSFISKKRLIVHHRIHTGDKPHKCMVCEQRFTQRGTLKRHMKVHDPMKAPLVNG